MIFRRLQSGRSLAWAALWITALCTIGAKTATAHIPVHGVGTATKITFLADRALLEFDLSYTATWAQGEMLAMDTNRDSVVQQSEADEYLAKQWKLKIAPKLSVQLDGTAIDLQPTTSRHEGLVGEIYPGLFSLYYTFEIQGAFLPSAQTSGQAASKRRLEIDDAVVRDEIPGKPRFRIDRGPQEGDRSLSLDIDFVEPLLSADAAPFDPETFEYLLESSRLVIDVQLSKTSDAATAKTGSANSDTGAASTAPPRPVDSTLDQETREAAEWGRVLFADHGFWASVGFFLLAFLYGAGHAFTPGHGKSMVAAYLIGTKGRIRDAVILGSITTFTHTFTVFLIGGILLLIADQTTSSEGALRTNAIFTCSVVSGAFLMVLGLTLFCRRYQQLKGSPPTQPTSEAVHQHDGHSHDTGHDHGSAHKHDHGHGHSHDHGSAHKHEHGHGHSHDHGSAHKHEHGHGHGHSHDHGSAHKHEHGHSHDQAHYHGSAHKHEHGHSHGGHGGGHDGGHDHGSSHSHGGRSHTHDHSHLFRDGEYPRFRELLALGFSGGILPCPAGLTVIAIGMQYPDKLLKAMLILVFFSLGLGAVLISIGVVLITGKMLAAGRTREGAFLQDLAVLQRFFSREFLATLDRLGARLIHVMPAFSCLIIVALGAFFTTSSILAWTGF